MSVTCPLRWPTRMPLVRQRVQALFGKEPHCELNPDEVVALGAAVQADILSGGTTDLLLLDVTPLSLGIETMGGVMSSLIRRNTTIPASAKEMFTTYVDGQTGVDIHILQGERELVKDNRSLARFRLKVPPLPAGVPRIEVTFLIDANGILNVSARDVRTGDTQSLAVKPSYGLSDDEVERMIGESFKFAADDLKARQLIEARTEAETIIMATEKAIKQGAQLVGKEDLSSIRASMAAVEAALSSEEKLLACISVRPEKISDQDAKPADLFEVGTLVMIKRMERVEDTLHLIVQGTDRIRVLEWVQEAPSAGRGTLPLDDFGTLSFTRASAVRDGKTMDLKALGAQAITMINGARQPLATPSVVGSDGGSFSITRTQNPNTSAGGQRRRRG